jgi:hypothetical protein
MTDEHTRSPLIFVGLAVAAFALICVLLLLGIDLLAGGRSPYLGMLTYLVLPGVLVFGLATAGVGVLMTYRRWKRTGHRPRARELWPRIDLNDPSQRRRFGVSMVGVALALPFLGVMSYEGYHFTDSNEFCGLVCHTVMEPHFKAYQASPHARVACVDCHIGSGATWYVKSKLSGARQVFAVVLDSYEKPIPPATHELRPAKETCQECHWPEKFFGDQLVVRPHFSSDRENTRRDARLLVKTGGADPDLGPPSGIHWHMALGHRLEYVALDPALQEIPWVRMTTLETGVEKVFRSDGLPHDAPPPEGLLRTLDCMDCHNRATHVFVSPNRAANRALNADAEMQDLPYAKRTLVRALSQDYPSKDAGLSGVRDSIEAFYGAEYPELAETRPDLIRRLAGHGERIFDTYVFPEMRASWKTYKQNIGHLEAPGCFRCHEGLHVDAEGQSISRDCRVCHEFVVQRPLEDGRMALATGEFEHVMALEGPHAEARCNACHTGGPMPPPTCAGCHESQAGFAEGSLAGLGVLEGFQIEADIMAGIVECTGCHALDAEDPLAAIAESCVDCHGDEFYADFLVMWKEDIDAAFAALPEDLDSEERALVDSLRAAGVYHNPDATIAILEELAKR